MTIEVVSVEFDPIVPSEKVFETARRLREECPVAHASADGGFWVISDYPTVLEVLQTRTFEVGGRDRAVRIPADPPGFRRPLMPPQDANPPLHRQFRALLNPHLSPEALARREPGFRRVIAGLVESFYRDGRCDLATQFAKIFPSVVTFRELFGIADEEQTTRARHWLTRIVYGIFREEPSVLAGAPARVERVGCAT